MELKNRKTGEKSGSSAKCVYSIKEGKFVWFPIPFID